MRIDTYTVGEREIEEIIRINSSYFPANSRALDHKYMRWLCTRNPFGPAEIVVASEGTEWVGITILIPIRLRRNSAVQSARFAINVLSHPDHRSKNIFVRLIESIRSRMATSGEWLIGHPNAAAIPGWTRKRMEFRQDLAPYILVPTLGLSTTRSTPISSAGELQSVFLAPPQDGKWRVDYSIDFIVWRYLADPLQRYSVYALSDRDGANLGIYSTCGYKHGIDLLVDAMTAHPFDVRSGVRPLLAMVPEELAARQSHPFAFRLPSKKRIRFFVSTWGQSVPDTELQGITLGASDF